MPQVRCTEEGVRVRIQSEIARRVRVVFTSVALSIILN